MPPAVEFVLLLLAVAALTRWARKIGATAGVPAVAVGVLLSLATE